MSGTSVADPSTRLPDKAANGRRGSKFADRQIAHAVKDERKVRIQYRDGTGLVEGWVYGMDDYHLGIVDVTGNTMLVHKSAAAIITFTDRVMDEGDTRIREICDPFRRRVMEEHFGQINPQ